MSVADPGLAGSADLTTALAHGYRLLSEDPRLAEAQADEILRLHPGEAEALVLLASARRRRGAPQAALAALEPLLATRPDWAQLHAAIGLALADLGQGATAIIALKRAVTLDRGMTSAWRALAEQLAMGGDDAAAAVATAEEIRASVSDPILLEAGAALTDNRLAVAERLLRDYLKRDPFNVPAIRMLAETGGRLGRLDDAERLLERCVELAPGFAPARHNYATVLYRQNKAVAALAQLEQLLTLEPDRPTYLNLKAAALGRVGDYDEAIAIWSSLLKALPDQPRVWLSFGHALKTVGRQAECIDAYRRAAALAPHMGEAWWSLANLKTLVFTAADVAEMERQLVRPDISDEDRLHLAYTLGKAFEDAGRYGPSFDHYQQGASLRRARERYDAAATTSHMERSRVVFTPDLLARKAGAGCPAPDPIFIVGLPRAGSTLIEQILSSHSAVEGTQELPDIISLARRLGGGPEGRGAAAYPESLAELDATDLSALGEEYLARTRVHRKTDRPFFIDKMPNNFAHVGLIHLILPKAKIIDARRHPMAGCFSAFKQHFARGQNFSYDLTDLGRYYADYVALMRHFDEVLPGRVHRVIYEDMIADPEAQTRALLDHCSLPFEETCLRFHETERAVRTASSEQVRRPIFTDALEQWRRYEAWLDPLETALGETRRVWRQ